MIYRRLLVFWVSGFGYFKIMPVRKKLLTYKNSPAVLVTYSKRHQKFLKTPFAQQKTQVGFFSCDTRYYFVDFLIQSATPGRITPMQVDAVQRILVRKFARLFRFWQLIRFTEMVTAKPNEIRMGKGKGAFAFWSRTVKVGFPLFEIGFNSWYPLGYFYHIFRRVRAKLPVHLIVRSRFNTRGY